MLRWKPVEHGQSRISRTTPEQLLGRYAIIGVALSLGQEPGPRHVASAEVVVQVQVDRSGVADIIRSERK